MTNTSNLSNETLVAIIVSFRLLGLNKDLAIKSMEELTLRESKGSDFDYNSLIEKELKDSPSPRPDKDIAAAFKSILSKDIRNL